MKTVRPRPAPGRAVRAPALSPEGPCAPPLSPRKGRARTLSAPGPAARAPALAQEQACRGRPSCVPAVGRGAKGRRIPAASERRPRELVHARRPEVSISEDPRFSAIGTRPRAWRPRGGSDEPTTATSCSGPCPKFCSDRSQGNAAPVSIGVSFFVSDGVCECDCARVCA